MTVNLNCDTSGNQIKWTVLGVFIVLGVIFLLGQIAVKNSVPIDYRKCIKGLLHQGKIYEWQKDYALQANRKVISGAYEYPYWDINLKKCVDEANEKQGLMILLFCTWFACFAGASVTFFVMCFCASSANRTQRSSSFYRMVYSATPSYTAYNI
eukprot:TRINITY_DN7123_c0_g1_i6.p2 TRINITY_DN7123_c0_g1~~TRINITY_DN7123_c0_g1_i6.p2  ORF type:complete len:154 (-),score=4.74 TRINITY_DN7123_c0_g1_i6:268-729(-)